MNRRAEAAIVLEKDIGMSKAIALHCKDVADFPSTGQTIGSSSAAGLHAQVLLVQASHVFRKYSIMPRLSYSSLRNNDCRSDCGGVLRLNRIITSNRLLNVHWLLFRELSGFICTLMQNIRIATKHALFLQLLQVVYLLTQGIYLHGKEAHHVAHLLRQCGMLFLNIALRLPS